ncbi:MULTISPECIES: MlaD family protein [Rhodococcus]|uniref:MlaD family protein n=1 Tax=Rhodococcus TaxID=1827 RepID=UPI0006602541|nr:MULTISPECIES: MlaD family protein [Rhodococcus]MCZ1074966.1 MlaD family protein [Rhodococcus sp. A5(2022)]QRE79486.1 MCE family protein [Rhodococcus ruber]UIR36456.1 MCE family protein [Rhodococcus sp. DMF-1]
MKRPVLVQVSLFVVLGLLATAFGVRYVLGPQSIGGGLEVRAHLVDARGIGPGTTVTYRGVAVGEIDSVTIDDGGRGSTAVLTLDPDTRIPVGSTGRVATGTAIGIITLDIEPQTAEGPYLTDGDTLEVPADAQGLRLDQMLVRMSALVESIDPGSVATLGETWGTALAGTGPDLQALLENADALSTMASERAPTLAALLEQGVDLVNTLAENSGTFPGAMRAVRDVSDQLAGSRDALVYLLDRSPEALAKTERLFADTRDDYGLLLTNLVTVGDVLAPRTPALAAGLDSIPAALGDLTSVVEGDRGDFSLVATQGPVCYYDTQRRTVGDESPRTPNLSLYCPPGEDLAQRGARVAPRPDDLGLQHQTTPAMVTGPDMAEDPLLVPTGVEVLQYWQKLLEGLGN